MQPLDNSYDVTLIKKIPYLTEFLLFLLLPGIVVLFLSFFFIYNSGDSPNEMQIVSLIKIIPEKMQYLLFYFGISTVLFYPLYKYVKIYKPAKLNFNEQFLSIRGKNLEIIIPIEKISKIHFKDPYNYKGESKQKLTIYIRKKFTDAIMIKLNDYTYSDELMSGLINIKNLNAIFSESNASMDFESSSTI